MPLDDLPHPEPMSPGAERFSREAMRRGGTQNGIFVSYGDDPLQSLLVFPAKKPTGPVIVFYHGGNWTNGSKDWFSYLAPALNARGITFVSAGYRHAPQTMFPHGFEDCLYGFDVAVRSVAEFGGDPNRMFVGGHDAGAHYAALMTLKSGWRDALSLPMDVVKGCLPVSGYYDFGTESGFKNRPVFLGAHEHKGERFASAIRYAYPQSPPFLVTYGSADLPHAMQQGHGLVRALRKEGVTAEELILEGQDHYGTALGIGEDNGPWLAAVSWLTGAQG
jgi:arylformamidase